MSASEWLHNVIFWVITFIALNLLAGIPTKKAKEKPDYKAHFKKTSKMLYYSIASIFALTLFATLLPIYWLLTGFLVFVSQVTLSISLTLLAIICLTRLVRSGNLLELLLIKAGRGIYFCLYPILTLFVVTRPHIPRLLSDLTKGIADDHEEIHSKERPLHHINAEGEYAPYDSINYKF